MEAATAEYKNKIIFLEKSSFSNIRYRMVKEKNKSTISLIYNFLTFMFLTF